MKRQTMAAVVMAMALAGGAHAQSLEESYADQCVTPAAKKSEVCQVMAKALVAKLQGEASPGDAPAPSAPASEPAPAPTAAELRARWGFLLDFIGKPTFAIDGETGTADTASRWVLEWQVPGEVLLRRKLGADGAELGSMTYAWSRYTASVERQLPSIGQIQTFSVEPNGNFTGTLLLNGTTGREKWESLGPTGYRITSETNEGQGWVLRSDGMWQLATNEILAGAQQSAAMMRQLYRNKKEMAELKAEMQGGMTDPEFDGYIAELIARNAAYAEARRLKREARAEAIGGFLTAVAGATAAVAEGYAEADTGGYAEAQANLDATVANIQYAAAAERQRQNASLQASAQPAQAAQPQQVQVSPGTPASGTSGYVADEAPGVPVQHESGAAAGEPLRFVMSISLRNLPGDKVNPTCYSNIISRPGPPGWGAPGFLPPGSAEQAREAVYSLKSAFIAQCRASGREITSDGNFNFQMNQSRGDEERLQGMHARYSEDVTVSL